MELASRIDGRIVPGHALWSSTGQADHHRAIEAKPRADKVLLAAYRRPPGGNSSGCTYPSSALRTRLITTSLLLALATTGTINPGVSDTVDALGSDGDIHIESEQVSKTVRARLEVMMRMRVLKCKEPKRCPEDFGKPLAERIRGMSIPELSDLCDRGRVFDQECCKATLGISRHKMVESAQVGLPARFPLSALRAAPILTPAIHPFRVRSASSTRSRVPKPSPRPTTWRRCSTCGGVCARTSPFSSTRRSCPRWAASRVLSRCPRPCPWSSSR